MSSACDLINRFNVIAVKGKTSPKDGKESGKKPTPTKIAKLVFQTPPAPFPGPLPQNAQKSPPKRSGSNRGPKRPQARNLRRPVAKSRPLQPQPLPTAEYINEPSETLEQNLLENDSTWNRETIWKLPPGSGSGHTWTARKFLGKGAFGQVVLWQRDSLNGLEDQNETEGIPKGIDKEAVKDRTFGTASLVNEQKIQYRLTKTGSRHIAACYGRVRDEMFLDIGYKPRRIFMEFCEGGSFQDFVDKHEKILEDAGKGIQLEENIYWRFLECLACGLATMEHGNEDLDGASWGEIILHNDIHGGNFLVGLNDEDHKLTPALKFADFVNSRIALKTAANSCELSKNIRETGTLINRRIDKSTSFNFGIEIATKETLTYSATLQETIEKMLRSEVPPYEPKDGISTRKLLKVCRDSIKVCDEISGEQGGNAATTFTIPDEPTS